MSRGKPISLLALWYPSTRLKSGVSVPRKPSRGNSFRQSHLNQWVKRAVCLIPIIRWDTRTFAVDPIQLEGCVCHGEPGFSSATDMTVFMQVFPSELVVTIMALDRAIRCGGAAT